MKDDSQNAEQKLHSTSLAKSDGKFTVSLSMIPNFRQTTLSQAVAELTNKTITKNKTNSIRIDGANILLGI